MGTKCDAGMGQEDKPRCFSTLHIYLKWIDARRMGPANERTHPVCRDCTPSYQLRMKRQGRCEHPETMFAVDRDGAVVGVMA